MVQICDFGAAVMGDAVNLYMHDIQPQQFRAPEVLLRAGWTYSADIWNLGMVLWELLENTSLLDGLNPDTGEYTRESHFAQMIRLLGPPPLELLNRADKAVYDDLYALQGDFRYSQYLLSEEFTFSSRTPFLEGEDKRLFIEFASKMLRWLPYERSTAKELSNDPWLSYNL